MKSQKANKTQIQISVIGSGIAGITTAFHLGKKGFKVNLIDPQVNSEINHLNPQNGSQAALGVLMGNIYKRSTGRAFFLRKRSMELWNEWLIEINDSKSDIKLEKPLIKLANSENEYQSMIEISKNKKNFGIEVLDQNSIRFWNSIFEKKIIGGLISYEDGRLDPIKLIKSILKKLDKFKVKKIEDNVIGIEKNNNFSDHKWKINLENNQFIYQDYIVICSGLNTQKLLKTFNSKILLKPVLGQAIELKLKENNINWDKWPAILNYQSYNFIHNKPSHIIIGATIESGTKPCVINKQKMLTMNNLAPEWIKKANVIREWSGLRARPANEPSPILKDLENGLLINSGHYRNGILLAPSCAEWIEKRIDQQIITN